MDSKDFEQLRSCMAKQIVTLNSSIDNPSLLKPAIVAIEADVEMIIASLEVLQGTIDRLAECIDRHSYDEAIDIYNSDRAIDKRHWS